MLKAMRSPAFRKDGKNSIGKSSAMQAIDFVFGGSTYIKGDGVKHVGHHTIFFTFEFDGQEYHLQEIPEIRTPFKCAQTGMF